MLIRFRHPIRFRVLHRGHEGNRNGRGTTRSRQRSVHPRYQKGSPKPHLRDSIATAAYTNSNWICREHREQTRLETPHNPQLQAKEEVQQRARQTQGPRCSSRGHTVSRHAQSQRLATCQLQLHHYAADFLPLPPTRSDPEAPHGDNGHQVRLPQRRTPARC